jgi:hypothetical protein
MKTTIEIPDSLLAALRKTAAREGVTMRELVEEGVRRALDARRGGDEPFRLRKASFKGQGLQPGLDGTSWQRIRDLAYEGRGS